MATSGYSALAVRETPTAGYLKPRLLDRVREAIRARHYSRCTEKAYVAWIKRYIFFHGKRHPAEMGAVEVTRFLTSLVSDAKGAKDGVTMLPAAAKPGLMRHLDAPPARSRSAWWRRLGRDAGRAGAERTPTLVASGPGSGA